MKGFLDLHRFPEDDRVKIIADVSLRQMKPGQTFAVPTDDEPGKPERYAMKISLAAPHVELVDKLKGPTPGVVTLRFRRI